MFSFIARTLFTLSVAFAVALSVPQTAYAQVQDWSGGCVYESATGTVATIQGAECLLSNILSVAVTFVGLAGFVMLIVGAFLYLTSGGNSKHTDLAKATFTYAIIGIIVALSAFFILNIIASFTGVRGFLRFDLSL